ncbi:MAG: alpha/beta hydrolase-fold protein, partial [Chloroflexota bacterium]|nr:alpha/beta hydrolase-fold protein [Chloroflexota bacterium]
CCALFLLVTATFGCSDAPGPTPAPDVADAEFFACYETCVVKGGSDADCRTFCAGGTVEPPTKDLAEAEGAAKAKDGAEAKDADPEECYTSCIAKGGDDSTCRGYCDEKPVVDGGKAAPDTSEIRTFEHDGVTRHYLYHAPPNLPANAPLLFFLHGHGGNAGETRAWVGLDPVADANGFAVVYPQGSGNYEGTPYWNAHTFPGVTDDIGFLSALVRSLQGEHGLDPERTYAAGFSNGGMMSYLLAMEAPDVFRGAASVVGAAWGSAWEKRESASSAFPLLQISGLDDTVVPIDGIVDPGGGPGAPAHDEIVAYWSERNGCSATETDTLNENTVRLRHVGCADGNEVWYYRIDNFGHEWPTVDGGAGFSGAEAIWEFFGRFQGASSPAA